jgi:acyl-coenzyme A synthetase/AMP-(fatty) acid ligase
LIRLYTNSPDLTLEAIRAHFAESRIPNTYLPRELIHMAELPVLRTGKVDYQTLQHLIKD